MRCNFGFKKKYRWVVDLVTQFGASIIPDALKTPPVLHIIYTAQNKIQAVNELKQRSIQGQLSDERLYDLVYTATGNAEIASTAVAKYILNTTKKPS